MVRAGVQIPPGFVVSSDACSDFFEDGRTLSLHFIEELARQIQDMERTTRRYFGGREICEGDICR
jgi:pyruvate,orthophosphate dikinase